MDDYAEAGVTGTDLNIHSATESYEKWLGKQLTVLPADLRLKHRLMAEAIFPFFRATFYRWIQRWPEVCEDGAKAPRVLAVGDLHVENFGTWRDVEGRLVWGINDFDEANRLPYTVDLVRLAASAHLAIEEAHLEIDHRDACEAIWNGYLEALAAGGRPFVLSELHVWLREAVHGVLRDPAHFWGRMHALKSARPPIPDRAAKGLEQMMPARGLEYRIAHRVAGLGSLGRQRYVALGEYKGGMIAREAKALAPSACIWAGQGKKPKIAYQEILDRSVRCLDPFVSLRGKWIVRRLAPDCSRVELDQVPKQRDESRLLFAMGFETANVHAGSGKAAAKAILGDAKQRSPKWLHQSAAAMNEALKKDWEEWRG